VTLELGGKSSAIVLEDADLDQVASVLLRTCLRNTGQTCYISTRILAPASRYDEVVDMVTRTVAAAPQGDPFDEATVFGPMASQAQYDVVRGFLDSARAEGARATTGGRPAESGPGWFIEPTVLADVTPGMRVAREEVFGPVVSVLRYDDLDEAVALANDTSFGLGGVVFSADREAALEVAERMDTGSVGLNFFASNHNAPFGGRHDSGLGVEYGIEGLAQYVSYKSIHRRTD
jgi:aldehyde dehydrogenase (NAD+)